LKSNLDGCTYLGEPLLGSDDLRLRYHVKLALREFNNEFDAQGFENAYNRYTDERRSQIRQL
jgi:hypothetical protein